jgi:two-component sensor histidine kinase/NAD(P)-dependent dehydrogenase (short-subunit alcohol dehydrogenase family)
MDLYPHLRTKSQPIQNILNLLQVPKNAFTDKVVFLTGGARGLGKEIVVGLAAVGATVYFIDKRKEEGEAVLQEVQDTGGKVFFLHEDVTNFEAVDVFLKEIEEKHGTIDFLINNAVEFVTKGIDQLSLEEWQYSNDTNVTAPLFLIQRLLPAMQQQNSGMIVNLIAVEGMAFAAAMSSSKASCRSLTISLASEIKETDNVTVIGYAPGMVDTPLIYENFTVYCEKLGYDFTDFILNITNNPGYEGLIPAAHSAASLIWYMLKGRENHGLICTPYLPLHKAQLIDLKDENARKKQVADDNITRSNQYIIETDKYQEIIENKIEIRTRELEEEKEKTTALLKNELKHSEELEALNLEKTNLLKEIHHRVKNNMQVISSLLNLQSNFVEDEKVKQLFGQSQSRILAMATVHNMLYRSSNFSKVDYGKYLTELCDHLLRSMLGKHSKVLFSIEAKEIKLNLDTSITIGLVVNEIVTNSLKHAFPEDDGTIYIRFDQPNDLNYTIHIGDNGKGFDNQQEAHPDYQAGLGMELISDLTEQLDGAVSMDETKPGTHYIIQFKESKL